MTKEDNRPILLGRTPVILLRFNCNDVNDVSSPILVGNSPRPPERWRKFIDSTWDSLHLIPDHVQGLVIALCP